jgi:squalene-associated FAD-dependent desaturase
VGGGLAGITAALDCADAGAAVTLVEVRPRLGGAAYSFERDGLRLDNGQHVFLRCCTAYRVLLARLASEQRVRIQDRLEIPILSPGGSPALLRRGNLPAPLHLAGALARHPYLRPTQRLGAARAAFALGRLDPAEQRADRETFGSWLAARGQGPEALAALWDLIALPTLNLPAAQASLELAAFVFKTGLLSRASAGDIGFHERPLGEILDEPARLALARAGVEVRLGWSARRLEPTAEGIELHARAEGRDEHLPAEALILAVPHQRAAGLLEPHLPELAARLERIGTSPIVNLHLVYDRPVSGLAFAAGIGTPIQYVFDRTAASGLTGGGQYIAVSLSGADREMAMDADALRERYLPALEQLFPAARQARLESFLVTREHAATFRAVPGVGHLRPGASTPIEGLLLAGSWTDTGWPATLEGAVLSGHTAAAHALAGLAGEQAGLARVPAYQCPQACTPPGDVPAWVRPNGRPREGERVG